MGRDKKVKKEYSPYISYTHDNSSSRLVEVESIIIIYVMLLMMITFLISYPCLSDAMTRNYMSGLLKPHIVNKRIIFMTTTMTTTIIIIRKITLVSFRYYW